MILYKDTNSHKERSNIKIDCLYKLKIRRRVFMKCKVFVITILLLLLVLSTGDVNGTEKIVLDKSILNNLEQELRIPQDELIEIFDCYGKERFWEIIEAYKKNIAEYKLFENDNKITMSAEYTMGQAGINILLNYSRAGSVWISRDGRKLGINHGHAALIYSTNSWNKRSIEARGSTVVSKVYDLEGDSYWQGTEQARVYNVSSTNNGPVNTTAMTNAASYAFVYLTGKNYLATPLKRRYKQSELCFFSI